MAHASEHETNVRVGPITVFTLVAVLCMAVLAVLSVSTANASQVMAQRQADAVSQMYLDEAAAQAFVAELDGALSPVREAGASGAAANAAVESALEPARQAAVGAARDIAASGETSLPEGTGDVQVSATLSAAPGGPATVNADFSCGNGRRLDVVITVRDDGTLRVDRWKMRAVQNEEQPGGMLWTGM